MSNVLKLEEPVIDEDDITLPLEDLIRNIIGECQKTLEENIYEAEAMTNELHDRTKTKLSQSQDKAFNLNKETNDILGQIIDDKRFCKSTIILKRRKLKKILIDHMSKTDKEYDNLNDKRKVIRRELENHADAICDSIENIETIFNKYTLKKIDTIENYNQSSNYSQCFRIKEAIIKEHIQKILKTSKKTLIAAEQKISQIEAYFDEQIEKADIDYHAQVKDILQECKKIIHPSEEV